MSFVGGGGQLSPCSSGKATSASRLLAIWLLRRPRPTQAAEHRQTLAGPSLNRDLLQQALRRTCSISWLPYRLMRKCRSCSTGSRLGQPNLLCTTAMPSRKVVWNVDLHTACRCIHKCGGLVWLCSAGCGQVSAVHEGPSIFGHRSAVARRLPQAYKSQPRVQAAGPRTCLDLDHLPSVFLEEESLHVSFPDCKIAGAAAWSQAILVCRRGFS